MKSVLLIGLNNFGATIARRMHDLGHQVMAIDRDEARVNAVLKYVTDAQIGDSTNEAFMQSLGVSDYDVCIVAIGKDFQSSLETTLLLKTLGAKKVVSRADRTLQARSLLCNGADEVLDPEKQIAEWAAIRYTSDNVLDYIKLDDDHAIYELSVPRDWVGKSIGQIDIRKKYGLNIMAVKNGGKMDLSVTPDTVLYADRTMLVLGEQRTMQKCFRI